MTSPVKLYQQEMHDNLGFFPTWLPGDPMEIGALGLLEAGRFRQESSLQELGVACTVTESPTSQDVQYTSTQGTKVSFAAKAAAAALAKAKVTIGFSRKAAFVFHATALRLHRLENRAAVAKRIESSYKELKWKKEWLLVESIHSADRATIIVSVDATAELALTVTGKGPIAGVSLADPKIGLTVASSRGKVMQILGAKGLRPLYACLRLSDPWFGKPELKPVRGPGDADIPWTRPGIDELLNS